MQSRRSAPFTLATLLVCGCSAVPTSPNASLDDAAGDGFLDVDAPTGVAFDEDTNVSVRLMSKLDKDDVAQVARTQGVAEEYIDLLPLVTLVARADLTLHYANDATGMFSESVAVAPFEKSFEFACPQSVDVVVRVDALLPVGDVQTVLESATPSLHVGEDYACGETIAYTLIVNQAGEPQFVDTQPMGADTFHASRPATEAPDGA